MFLATYWQVTVDLHIVIFQGVDYLSGDFFTDTEPRQGVCCLALATFISTRPIVVEGS